MRGMLRAYRITTQQFVTSGLRMAPRRAGGRFLGTTAVGVALGACGLLSVSAAADERGRLSAPSPAPLSVVVAPTGADWQVVETEPLHPAKIIFRAIAFVIDSTIVGIASGVLRVFVPSFVVDVLVGVVGVCRDVLRGSRSIGKRWMELRIRSEDGSEATALQKVLRNSLSPFAAVLATSLPFAGAPLLPFVAGLFNYVPMFFSSRSQTLGDMLAGTVIVKTLN